MSVVKTASSNPVASGAQLTYTIVVTNLGSSKVDNVVMTDQVNGVGVIQAPPALPQLTITSSKGSCAQGGPNGNVVTCNAGTLAGRAIWTVTIRGQVTAATNTVLNNTASVTGTKSAQTFTTTGSTSVLVSGGTGGGDPLPDLTINKTGPTSVALGSPLTYTLTVNNLGTANTANVRVVDTLPVGVAVTSYETTSLFTCSPAAPVPAGASPITVTCTGGAVNQGQNATIKINATSPASGATITNTAVVDPDNTITESNELNNTSASVNTSLQGPPPEPLLTIKKSDGNPGYPDAWDNAAGPNDPVNPGESLTYVILVTNTATSRADDVRISDTTQGLEASSLVVSQVVSNGSVGTGRGCVVNAAEAVCSIRSLNAGGTLTMTVTGKVIAPAGTNLFNTATVHGNIRNVGVTNTASESTTVRPSIDLTITKDDSPDPVCARSWPRDTPPAGETGHLANDPTGQTPASGDPTALLADPVCLGGLTYDFVIGNSGNGPALNNVTVMDRLAAGLIFDSYASSTTFDCKLEAGNVVRCTGGSVGAASTETLSLRVVAPPNVGSITNTVTVDPDNAIFEPDETNNSDTETTTVSTGVDLVIWKGDDTFDTVDTDDTDENPPGDAPALDEGFDPIATNGTQTYTIIVDNIGPQDVTGIKVRDVLPAGTRFLSFSANQGFTCTHDGSTYGGNVTCIGGSLPGTEREFYDQAGSNPAGTNIGNKWATIKIKVFATPFVQPILHNEVRVDPDNEIDEVNELNNFAFQNTLVGVGNDDRGAFNQLTVEKLQNSPTDGDPLTPDVANPNSADPVATNGILIYDLKVSNLGTDPVSAVIVKDTLPSGTRFISARDTDVGTSLSDAFFCSHDGSATGGVVTCFGGDLSGSVNSIPDGAGTVPTVRTIRVRVFAPNNPGTIVNIVGVDPDNAVAEGNEFDNDAALETPVRACTSALDCTATNAYYELTIDKTQDAAVAANPVARNGIVSYNLVIANLGSDPVSGIVVRDTLPTGARFIDAKDSAPDTDPHAFTCGTPNTDGVFTCTGGSLSGTVTALAGVPTSRTIVVRAFAPDTPGSYPNLAQVDPTNSIPEGNEFNNQDSVITIVTNGGNNPFIDLDLVKAQVVPSGDVPPGGQIGYTLTISNEGEADAFNVTVRDVLPQYTLFHNARDLADTAGKFTCGITSPGVLTCTGGTIPAGGSRTIAVNVDVIDSITDFASDPENVSVLITNQATVDPDNAILEGDETDNADFVDTTIRPLLNLKLEKEGSDTATQNDTTKYKIKVTNEIVGGGAGATAFGVKIVDPLPIGLIPLSVTAEPGNFTCQLEENPVNLVTCVGDLEAGDTVTIEIEAFVTANGGTLDNEACVDPDDTISESNELDNCKHKIGQVLPPTPDLLINKAADKGTVSEGEDLVYTLTISNVGTGNAVGTVTVSDSVPSQVTVQDINPDGGWDCTASSGNTVSCERTNLDKGSSSHIEVRTTANSGLTAPFSNSASVVFSPDPGETAEANTDNNSDSVTTSVGGAGIDLQVTTITDTPDPVNTRPSQLTYTIIAVNNGTAGTAGPSADPIVRVDLPDTGITVTGVSGTNGFNCSKNLTVDPSGFTYDCVGDFAASGDPGSSTEITAVVTVNAGAPNDLVVQATVDPGLVYGESDETNNTLTETTTVSGNVCTTSPCIDLVVADVLDEPQTADVSDGDTITYTVSVVNVGDTPISTSTVWDMHFLYTGTGTISVSAPSGITCAVFPTGGLDPNHVHCVGDGTQVDPMDLAAGGGILYTVTVTPTSAGTVSLEAYADIFGSVSEFSESNNVVTEATAVVS